jgi:hypothetical protein
LSAAVIETIAERAAALVLAELGTGRLITSPYFSVEEAAE